MANCESVLKVLFKKSVSCYRKTTKELCEKIHFEQKLRLTFHVTIYPSLSGLAQFLSVVTTSNIVLHFLHFLTNFYH